MIAPERRFFTCEVRTAQDNDNVIQGYGSLFGVPSVDMGFIETVDKRAFAKTDFSDVRMLNDHQSHMILARTKSGTLTVSVDERGLFYSGQVADTSYGRDLLVSVRRGDVDQSSYGFSVRNNGDEWEMRDGVLYRHLVDIESVVDVSPTAFPAFPQTHIDSRKVAEIRNALSQIDPTSMRYLDAMVKVHRILYS